jgi:hypothetical protein
MKCRASLASCLCRWTFRSFCVESPDFLTRGLAPPSIRGQRILAFARPAGGGGPRRPGREWHRVDSLGVCGNPKSRTRIQQHVWPCAVVMFGR